MLLNLTTVKNVIKRQLIKGVSIEQAFSALEKCNIVPEERLNVSEAQDWIFASSYQKYLEENNYEIKTSAYTTVLENVIYCPRYNIILTQNRNIILDSFNVQNDVANFDFQAIFNPRVEKIEGYSLIFQQTTNNYYHTVIENIPRFYLSCEHPIIKNATHSVNLLSSVPLLSEIRQYQKFYLEKLMPDSMVEKIVDREKNYLLEKLIISPFLSSSFAPSFMPKNYREKIFNRFLPQRPRKANQRIYISREKAYNGRHIINEDELFIQLEKYGFKKYLLEKLTIAEEVELFYDAEIIIGAYGAGMTNMIFADKAKVIELFPVSTIAPHYYYLAKSMGHSYHYWCGNQEKISDAFTVNVEQILEFLH